LHLVLFTSWCVISICLSHPIALLSQPISQRRWNRDDREEDFDPDIFRRQSVMLREDESSIPRSPSRGQDGFNPRPPTMIERHLANATPVSSMGPQFGYPYVLGNHNVQYDENAYNPSGAVPGQLYMDQNPFHNPYGDASMANTYDPSYNGNLAHQPTYLSRQPAGTGIPVQFENQSNDAQYVDMNRSSVTPFQAAQYEEISRRLEITSPVLGPVVEEGSHIRGNIDGAPDFVARDTHVPQSTSLSPHLNPNVPPQPSSPLDNPMSPVYQLNPSPRLPAAPPPARVTEGKRPDTVYTMYGDEDAYGGI
jgi:hypothetical protein